MRTMETPEVDWLSRIPLDLFPLILSSLECLSFGTWQSWRTISKYWYHAIYRRIENIDVTYRYNDESSRKLVLEEFSSFLRSLRFIGPVIDEITPPPDQYAFYRSFKMTGLHTLRAIHRIHLGNFGTLLDPSLLVEASRNWPLLHELELENIVSLEIDHIVAIMGHTPRLKKLCVRHQLLPTSKSPNRVKTVAKTDENLYHAKKVELHELEALEIGIFHRELLNCLPLGNVRTLRLVEDLNEDYDIYKIGMLHLQPNLTQLDMERCKTTFFTSEWYSAASSIPVETLLAYNRDVLDLISNSLERPLWITNEARENGNNFPNAPEAFHVPLASPNSSFLAHNTQINAFQTSQFFPNLTTLKIGKSRYSTSRPTSPNRVVQLSIVFQLPNLTYLDTWECLLAVPKPPNLELGETPFRACTTLRHWRLAPAPGSVNCWTWAVLQLTPSLTSLTLKANLPTSHPGTVQLDPNLTTVNVVDSCLLQLCTLVFDHSITCNAKGEKIENFENFADSMLACASSQAHIGNIPNAKNILPRLTSLDLRGVNNNQIISKTLIRLDPTKLKRLSLHGSSNVLTETLDIIGPFRMHQSSTERAKLRKSKISKSSPIDSSSDSIESAPPQTSSPSTSLSNIASYSTSSSESNFEINEILEELDLAGCARLTSLTLQKIAIRLPNLTKLDISGISSIWTIHLRYLEPLENLRFLGHAVSSRPMYEMASFQHLSGFWPKLTTFKVESTADTAVLASVFGPLVKILLVDFGPARRPGDSKSYDSYANDNSEI